MKIRTQLISDFKEEKKREYIYQIAGWHHGEWGKHRPGVKLEQWKEELYKAVQENQQLLIIAVDAENNLLGSVALKKRAIRSEDFSMEEKEFSALTPCWLSGLYVKPEARGDKVSALLIKHLAEIAKTQGQPCIHLFTHNLALEDYYKKFGWEVMESSSGERYVYLKGEILLFRATSEQVLKKAEACISKSYTANKHSTFTEYTQKITLPMELALKYLQWKIIPPFPAAPLDNKLKNQSTLKEGENMHLTSRS